MITIALVALVVAFATPYFTVHPPPPTPPATIRNFSIRSSILGESAIVWTPSDNSITPAQPYDWIPVLNDTASDVDVTVTNAGNVVVYLRQITLTSNSTLVKPQITAIDAGDSPLAPNQYKTFNLLTDP